MVAGTGGVRKIDGFLIKRELKGLEQRAIWDGEREEECAGREREMGKDRIGGGDKEKD